MEGHSEGAGHVGYKKQKLNIEPEGMCHGCGTMECRMYGCVSERLGFQLSTGAEELSAPEISKAADQIL